MLKKSKKGFTIVELVIVIAVIGILSAILIPTFANLTTQAQQTALKSNLAAAYSMYASEAGDGQLEIAYTADASETKKTVAIEFKGQQEVFLVDAKDATTGYVYSAEDKGWNINKVEFATHFGGTKTKTNVLATATYGDKTNVDFSKFGDFYFFYAA